MKVLRLFLFLVILFNSLTLKAQWNKSSPIEGNGSINQISSNSFSIVGNNDFTPSKFTYIYLNVSNNQTISFDWSYSTTDYGGPRWDPFSYSLNDAEIIQITNIDGASTQNGSTTIVTTSAGVLKLGIYSIDGAWGSGNVTISELTGGTLINISPIATLTACSGTASSYESFVVSGSDLTASVTITAPSYFEISTNSVGPYTPSSLTLTNTSTVSQTMYVRLSSSAPVPSTITGTITATSSGTTASITVSGTVNAIPSISITETDASGSANNDSKVCKGGTAILTASGGDTYLWSTSANSATITPSLSSNTTYTVTGTSAAGCSNITNVIITVEALPTLSVSSISLCAEATYLITKTSEVLVDNGWSVTGDITVNNGYVTAGTTPTSLGSYTVSYTDGCAQTVSATVDVATTSTLPTITDGQASYKFDGTPKGPSSASYFVGYNGFSYSSPNKPTNTGFYKANNQSGTIAGCPYPFYIFRCTTCPTVPL